MVRSVGIAPWDLALAVTVPITYAIGNTYIKWKLDHLDPLPMTVLFLGIAGLLLLPLQLFPELLARTGLGRACRAARLAAGDSCR